MINNKPPWRPLVSMKRCRRQTTEPALWTNKVPRERPVSPKLFLGLKQRTSPLSFRGDWDPACSLEREKWRHEGVGGQLPAQNLV